jgi:hypothetical protein
MLYNPNRFIRGLSDSSMIVDQPFPTQLNVKPAMGAKIVDTRALIVAAPEYWNSDTPKQVDPDNQTVI